jgi:tryptophan 2,3-dioxygenase
MSFDPEVLKRLEELEAKYAATGQDMKSYLEGLLYTDYLKYWDYIHLDVLLNLQTPRTSFPDEEIFIIYHQITELYFKLAINAMKRITDAKQTTAVEMVQYLKRINDYFRNLIHSYEIMVDGMDKEQFLKFRMSLLPASGFQSAQYRIIEMLSTDAYNLVSWRKRPEVAPDDSPVKLYEHFYWKEGGKELASGKKTLTLLQFEEKYTPEFEALLAKYKDSNLLAKYRALPEEERNNADLVEQLREMDLNVEIRWPLMHYRSAVRYLQKDPEDIKATGGTNWQQYLPPRFQKIYLFPDLFSDEEKEQWGRSAQAQARG